MADVIGSAEIEIRATRRQLKSDLAQAERETAAELKKVEAAAKGAQRELQRAFSEVGQDEFERSMRVIRNASEHTEQEVRDAADRVAKDLKGRYRDLGADIGQTLMGVSRTAQVAFAAITAYSLKLASDAGEIESAFKVAFGSAEAGARSFSDTLADTVGRDAVVLREQMTRLQLVLTGTGVAADTAAKMVEALTTSGVDAGSLFNTSDAESLQKIISGLTGETEPLKAFGVVISQAAVEAELLRLGFKGNAAEASEAAKSIARANLIIKGLSVAQGDATRTADSAANVTKRMTAEFNTAARDLGTQLLPAMTKLFGATTDVLRAFNDLPGGVQVAGLAFLGLIAAGGPIAGLLANLGRVISLARQTRAALIAAGAAGAGAGAAAGAGGAAAAAGRMLPGVSTAAAVLSLKGDTGPLDLDALIRSRQREVERSSTGNRAALERSLQELYRLRAQQNAGLEAAAAAAVVGQAREAGITPGRNTEATVAGGFTLPSGLRTGSGSTAGSRRAATGPTAAELAAMREALDLQNQIDVARTAGDAKAVRALEDRQALVRLTADFERAGYEDAANRAQAQVTALSEARTKAEQMAELIKQSDAFWEQLGENADKAADAAALLTDQTLDRLGYELELARLGGSEGTIKDAERRLFIETRMLEIMRLKLAATEAEARAMAGGEFATIDAATEGREMAESVVSLLRSDDIWEEAGRRFKDAAWDGVENLLAQLFSNMNLGGKDGGSGWVGAIASLFGKVKIPGFASGVTNFSGGLAYVHQGEVLANLAPGTDVIPAHAVGKGSSQPIHFDLRGAVMTADLLQQMEGMATQAGMAAYGAATKAIPAALARRGRQQFR
jgi:hypothetical protein